MLAATIVLGTALTSCSIADDPVTNPSGETTDKARLTIIYYGTIGQDNDNTAEDMWKTAQQMLKEHKVAEQTGDPQLQEISQKIDEAFDEMILARREVHGGTYGDLPKFSLSFILKNQESYEQQTLWGYTFEEGYQYTNWHLLTDWGKWLKMNQQAPKDQKNKVLGQPVGQTL